MKKFIKNKKIIFFLVFILIVVPISVNIAIAEGLKMQTAWPVSPMTQINLQDIDPQQDGNQIANITYLIAYLYEWGIALGGIVAFIALLIAGFHYMTSVGDPTKMKEATNRIKAAIGGLALLLGSWLILHTINPELTILRTLDFEARPELAVGGLDIEGMGRAQPCKYVILFRNTNFSGDEEKMAPGGRLTTTWIPKSYIMCREIKCRDVKCRPINEGETRNVNCPENQTLVDGEEARLGYGCPPYQVRAETIQKNDQCRVHFPTPPGRYLVEGGICEVQFFSRPPFLVFWGCRDHIVTLRSFTRHDLSGIDRVQDTSCVEIFSPVE